MSAAPLPQTADTATAWLVALHLGALHPVEQALTVALAFGPFVVLGVVVALRRRADRAEQAAAHPDPATPDPATRDDAAREAREALGD